MKIGDYFSGIERSLRRIKSAEIEGEVTCLTSDDFNGLVRCRVVFWDGSYLDLYEVVSTEMGHPIKLHYAYTYLKNGARVFRYDNAPHHSEISTHPHHKHIGEQDKLMPAEEPTFSQVLSEIEKLLTE
ncbi:MAG: DUF6516 family protein [Anaerolineales bacterium]|nr:DUF6516 family protein [Anaerolineales bacterium]